MLVSLLCCAQSNSGQDCQVHADSAVALGLAQCVYQSRDRAPVVEVLTSLWLMVTATKPVSMQHVSGHSGHPWNELSDAAAK
eukprot:109432-Alexandrium_andersonii.AAC.1